MIPHRFLYLLALLGCGLNAMAAPETPAVSRDSLPSSWAYSNGFEQTLPASDVWWDAFGDPVLTSLIERGQQNNYDIRQALRRVEIAKNQMDVTRAGYYPTVDLSASWSAMQSSGRTTHSYAETAEVHYFSIGASANWEADVFGRIKEQLKADKAQVALSRADYDAAQVSMAASIAKAYVQLRLAQAQLEVAGRQLESQKVLLHKTEVRLETGLNSGLDVAQAKTVVLTTEASIPAYRQSVESAINTVALLTGSYVGDVAPILEPVAPIPSGPAVINVGVPVDLLRRRPDVAEAEAEIALYSAQLGIAQKDWLPTLSVSGSLATESSRLDRLFFGKSYSWQVAPQISWTVFDGFSRKYQDAAARLNLENSVDAYNQTMVSAYSEVESAMVAYTSAVSLQKAQEALLAEAEHSLKLSSDLYIQGLTDYSNVMSAQISCLQAQNSILSAKAQAATALISLYQALGGGWQ